MDALFLRRLLTVAGLGAAVLAAAQLAQGELALAAALAGATTLGLLWWLLRLEADVLLAGAALFGYLVGNRGFAQLHLSLAGLPLPPAEIALAAGLVAVIWRGSRAGRLPLRRDALNLLILLWAGLAAAQLPFDLRQHGFVAARDFATIYYALFFFLAQEWGAEPRARRWLHGCLLAGFALTAPAFAAYSTWPEFFFNHLTVAGTPLIYVKSDVAGGLMVAGAVWFLLRCGRGRRLWWLLPAAGALAGAVLCNSRAALVALAVVVAWTLVLRQGRLLLGFGALGLAGLLALVGQGVLSSRPWTESKIYRLYESVTSMTDIRGQGTYVSADLADKPDNNSFRRVWWQTVINDTTRQSPWLGQGFGTDLAEPFIRAYQPDSDEDLTVRSPHSFLVTIYARMGAIGFAALMSVLTVVAWRTWRTRSPEETAAWLGAWAILTSACFGVVLEGPMGGMVFWTLLGLASAAATTSAEETESSETNTEKATATPT